jgi:hypothetical protein
MKLPGLIEKLSYMSPLTPEVCAVRKNKTLHLSLGRLISTNRDHFRFAFKNCDKSRRHPTTVRGLPTRGEPVVNCDLLILDCDIAPSCEVLHDTADHPMGSANHASDLLIGQFLTNYLLPFLLLC